MTCSDLAYYWNGSPNRYSGRAYNVCKITPHHMAGALSIEGCASVFDNPSRQASSNYGIGSDGRIACYVDEDDAAWTSSSWWNDNQAITIEVANTPEGVRDGTWAISDAAWRALVDLCVDICRRYDFRLEYTGDESGSLTEHRMFAPTGCPGDYLHYWMPTLAEEVNARLDGEEPTVVPVQEPGKRLNYEDLKFQAHSQNVGWNEPVFDGQVAGTTGFGMRMECIAINPPEGYELEVDAHIAGIGWRTFTGIKHGTSVLIGTTGEARAIEALIPRVVKRPANAGNKDLYYRVHQQNYGWKGWTRQGYCSGSDGLALQLEAIQMVITDDPQSL